MSRGGLKPNIRRGVVHLLDFNAGEANRGVAALVRLCGPSGVVVHEVRRSASIPPPGGSWVLSGGPGSPLEPGPWRAPLYEALRARVAKDLPTLAVCFGFEVLAAALGAELRPLRTPRIGVWRLRCTDAGLEDAALLGCEGAGTFENRRWGVFGGPGRVLAVGDEGDTVAARYGPAVLGTIFHPEADAPSIRALLNGPHREEVDGRYGPDAPERMLALDLEAVHRRVVGAWLAGLEVG
jgi:GMP synthase (glutamine-hydrolysing)